MRPFAVSKNPVPLFSSAQLPIAVFVSKFPPPRPIVIPFTRISPATSRIADGVFVPIPSLPERASQ